MLRFINGFIIGGLIGVIAGIFAHVYVECTAIKESNRNRYRTYRDYAKYDKRY